MENYIGKICPYCKTPISEYDTVKVCPSCGIPHHEGCWNENRGCTTFGCDQQHYEPQHTNPTEVCATCGAPLGEGQAFCTKCGASKVAAPQKNLCGKCGAELAEGQAFCPNCGQRAGLTIDAGVSSAINQFNANVQKSQQKKPGKLIAIIAAVLAAVLALVLVVPALSVSVEDLCAEGKYEEAYEKADASQKLDVLAEHVIALRSQEASEGLKDPSSFELRDAWYYAFMHEDGAIGGYAILYVSGKNSYGAKVSSYWAYTLNSEREWTFWGTCDTVDEEKGDELSDKLVKIVVEAGMRKGEHLTREQIKRINAQFQADTLYQVRDVNWSKVDTSGFYQD